MDDGEEDRWFWSIRNTFIESAYNKQEILDILASEYYPELIKYKKIIDNTDIGEKEERVFSPLVCRRALFEIAAVLARDALIKRKIRPMHLNTIKSRTFNNQHDYQNRPDYLPFTEFNDILSGYYDSWSSKKDKFLEKGKYYDLYLKCKEEIDSQTTEEALNQIDSVIDEYLRRKDEQRAAQKNSTFNW